VEFQEDGAMDDLSRLDGKVAVITGAAQGIGEATARLFAERGIAGLLLTDRNAEPLTVVADSLRATTRVEAVVADLANPAEVQTIIPAAEAAFGRVDILANIAGLTDRGTILDTSVELFDRLFAVNVRAPFLLMQGAVRIMTRDGIEGTIINILSVNAHAGGPNLAAYSGSKGALATLTKNVANSMLDHRIRVNGINLGWTATPGEHVIIQRSGQGGPDWLEKAEAERPFGRLIQPAEVARLIAFLATPESGVMTGALIDYDQQVVGINRVAPQPKSP
jgi:NAD(P)-dependent dehydrogenase (short-subunit alcohol dehydrogenase family)